MAKFVVYGRPGCPWCEKALNLLVARGQNIEYINVRESDENMKKFRNDFPNATTVPQIISYKHPDWPNKIGGYTELKTWFEVNTVEGSDI